jgi:hypothetical protein
MRLVTRRCSSFRLALVVSAGCLWAGLSGCSPPEDTLPDPSPGHTWNQTHRVELPPGWTVTARNVGLTDESTSLSGPDGKGCLVSTWSSKPDRYARPPSPRFVSVQGRLAFYGPLDPHYGPYPRAVVWQGADHHWFGVSCDLGRTGVLALAEGVRSGDNPMRVPFRLRSEPDGVSMVQLIEGTDRGVLRAGAQFQLTVPTGTSGRPRPLTMEISVDRDGSVARGTGERARVGGRDVEVRRASQSICLPTTSDPVCISGPGDEPATDWGAAARRVAQQTAELLVPVDDPSDESTWVPADQAFPW